MLFVLLALVLALLVGFWSHHGVVESLIKECSIERMHAAEERALFEVDRKRMTAAIIARNSGEAGRALRDRPRPDPKPEGEDPPEARFPYGL